MRVIEVNPGAARSGAQITKLLGEATSSHRVQWREGAAPGARAAPLPPL